MLLARLVVLWLAAAAVLGLLQRLGDDRASGRLALLVMPLSAVLVIAVGVWQIVDGHTVRGAFVVAVSNIGLGLLVAAARGAGAR